MTPEEKERRWQQTLDFAQRWDPLFLKLVVAAIVARNGDLKTCEAGCHTMPTVRITVEEFVHIANNYVLELRAPEYGVLELSAIDKEYLSEHHEPPRI